MPDDLESRLDAWEKEGLISRVQGEAILRREGRTRSPKSKDETTLPTLGWRAELFVLLGGALAMLILVVLANAFGGGEIALWLISSGVLIASALLPLAARRLVVLWDALALAGIVWSSVFFVTTEQGMLAIGLSYLVVPACTLLLFLRFDRLVLALPAGTFAAFVSVRVWTLQDDLALYASIDLLLLLVVLVGVGLRFGKDRFRFWRRRRAALKATAQR